MSIDSAIEIKLDKRLLLINGLATGLIGSGVALGIFQLTEKEPSFSRWAIMFFACALAIVITLFVQLKFGTYDYLSVTISDKEITGSSGEAFAKNKVTFALNEIDVDKTNKTSLAPLSFAEKFWSGKKRYIWSINGQKILIVKSLFSSEQIKMLSEKTGCII
jgi:hypothetical protein